MEIQLCKNCDGSGKIIETDIFGDHEYVTCKKCKGSGRLYCRKYHLTIPYQPDYPEEYYELDNDIVKKIHLFETKCNENT